MYKKRINTNVLYMVNREYKPLNQLPIKELCVFYCYLIFYNILAGGYKEWLRGRDKGKHMFNLFQCVCGFYNVLFGDDDLQLIPQYCRHYLNQLVKHGWLEYCPSKKKTRFGDVCGYYVLKEEKRKYLNTKRRLPCKSKIAKIEEDAINTYLIYEILYKRLHKKVEYSTINVMNGTYKEDNDRLDKEILERKGIFKNIYKKFADYNIPYIYRNTYFTKFLLGEEIPPQELTQQDIQYLDAIKLKQLKDNKITYEEL